MKDEEERKNNLIVFDVPDNKGSGEQKAADSNFFDKPIKETLEVDFRKKSVRKMFRLGKYICQADKPRPLLARFDSQNEKLNVIKETKKN